MRRNRENHSGDPYIARLGAAGETIRERRLLVLEGGSSRLRELVVDDLHARALSGQGTLIQLAVGNLVTETAAWLSQWTREGKTPDFLCGVSQGILFLNDLESAPFPLVRDLVRHVIYRVRQESGIFAVVLGCDSADILRDFISSRYLRKLCFKLSLSPGLVFSFLREPSPVAYRRCVTLPSTSAARKVEGISGLASECRFRPTLRPPLLRVLETAMMGKR